MRKIQTTFKLLLSLGNQPATCALDSYLQSLLLSLLLFKVILLKLCSVGAFVYEEMGVGVVIKRIHSEIHSGK